VPFNGPYIEKQETIMARAAARHILVETEQRREDLKTQIEAGADFAEAAQEHSKCPFRQSGGALACVALSSVRARR
jgi:parvulin-like peptidyl-prolyl isomerase